MSDQEVQVQDLLGKVSDEALRKQFADAFNSLSGSTLRKQLDEVQVENKTLKSEKRQRVYRDAGIPDAAFDVLDKVYDGELEVDKIREYATEKGFALGEPGKREPEATPDPAAARTAGEQRFTQLARGTIPPRDASTDDQIAAAEKDGDWPTFNRLQAQKLEAVRRAS